ncbi:MAG: DNA repair exonuclease [Gammaproteobacteria bacterium]|nr:DNA repair exonuclease [Gammaproteobacteria bacterium]
MDEAASILAIGDVHLGTACSGIPATISDSGVDPGDLSPASALQLAVDFAIEQQVDTVLFAGDVVESTNARFEAMLPLETSIMRLLEADIGVVAVAGNHDVEALPRLHELIGEFKLLGAGGRWEAHLLSRDDKPFAEVVGWSFGERRVRQSPLAELLRQPIPRPSIPIPRIGLLHCDLGASGGYYAPVRQSELEDAGFDAWLLGHIHKPSYEGLSGENGSRPCGYLGSLVGLDASETGPHGPWLVEIEGGKPIGLRQIPIAPLRWENLTLSMSDIEHVEDVPDRLLAVAREKVEELAEAGPTPLALGLRLTLTGSSAANEAIRSWVRSSEWRSLLRRVDDTVVFFNKVVDAMQLRVDLEGIASGDDPPALLAQRLLALKQNDDRARALLDQARERLGAIAREEYWSPVDEHRNATDPLSDDALRDVLLRSGSAALSAMLADQEAIER